MIQAGHQLFALFSSAALTFCAINARTHRSEQSEQIVLKDIDISIVVVNDFINGELSF